MNNPHLDVVIAERVLEGHADGAPRTVLVQVGKPFRDPDAKSCWYCPYRITGDEQRTFYGAGIDSVQALRIALANIAAELAALYSDLHLQWMGSDDLGFSGGL